MTELIVYAVRCVIMLLITWAGIRLLGKKTIAQMTAYELAGLMLLTTVAAEPLVVKVTSKAAIGVVTIGFIVLLISFLSLNKVFYNLDSKPDIVIANGKIDHRALRKNQLNLPFFLSMLREKGYSTVSEVEYAIVEPNGNLSVFPKAMNQPVTLKDLQLHKNDVSIGVPVIIDGIVQKEQLAFSRKSMDWLVAQCKKEGLYNMDEIFLAEVTSDGSLHFDTYDSFKNKEKPPLQ